MKPASRRILVITLLLTLVCLIGGIPLQAYAGTSGSSYSASNTKEDYTSFKQISTEKEMVGIIKDAALAKESTVKFIWTGSKSNGESAVDSAEEEVENLLRNNISTVGYHIFSYGSSFNTLADGSYYAFVSLTYYDYTKAEIAKLTASSSSASTTTSSTTTTSTSSTKTTTSSSSTTKTTKTTKTAAWKEKQAKKKAKKIIKKLHIKKTKSAKKQAKYVKKIENYLMKHVRYKYGYGSAYSALILHKSVCSGYAKAFKMLCDQAGIKCYYVTGSTTKGGKCNHAWNVVKIGKKYYGVDVCWDDGRGTHRYLLNGSKRFKKHYALGVGGKYKLSKCSYKFK